MFGRATWSAGRSGALWLGLLAASLLGCDSRVSAQTPAASASATRQPPPTFNGRALYTGPHKTPKGMKGLTIAGYNYTDSYIDSFTVNGAGGGEYGGF